jgi:hypothetical protein
MNATQRAAAGGGVAHRRAPRDARSRSVPINGVTETNELRGHANRAGARVVSPGPFLGSGETCYLLAWSSVMAPTARNVVST